MSVYKTAKHFIFDKNYGNILRMISGFCGNANCILSYSETGIFVPGIHSN